MNYETLASAAQQGGTVYMFLIFLAGCAYALWPKKRAEFEKAARLPLEEREP
jgi:cytochrome c oxidase cbb3-type subunit 4